MAHARASTQDRGRELHRFGFNRALVVLQRVALLIAALTALAPVALLVAAVIGSRQSAWTVALVIGGGFLYLAGSGAVLALAWRSTSMAMVVTTTGIEVRGYWIRRWIPWDQIAMIESSTHWYWRRATCIHTHHTLSANGERITAVVTAYQYIFWRNEPYDARARDPREHLAPTRAAMDAHRRYLRGEFSAAAAGAREGAW